jgi:transcriptional regulator with XRE-family HTH domain
LRTARGLRQDDLEDFGLSWKSVQKIEYGITDPKASTLLKLSHAFQMSLAELLQWDQPRAKRR